MKIHWKERPDNVYVIIKIAENEGDWIHIMAHRFSIVEGLNQSTPRNKTLYTHHENDYPPERHLKPKLLYQRFDREVFRNKTYKKYYEAKI